MQYLPWTATSGDVRDFFAGLQIPDGGVHIIGGRKGNTFIAFTSDEDARKAMRKDGSKLKGTKIKLLLSSHQEMERMIQQVTGVSPVKSNSETKRSMSRNEESPERRGSKLSYSIQNSESQYPHHLSAHVILNNSESSYHQYSSPHSGHHRSRSPFRKILINDSCSRKRHMSPILNRADFPHLKSLHIESFSRSVCKRDPHSKHDRKSGDISRDHMASTKFEDLESELQFQNLSRMEIEHKHTNFVEDKVVKSCQQKFYNISSGANEHLILNHLPKEVSFPNLSKTYQNFSISGRADIESIPSKNWTALNEYPCKHEGTTTPQISYGNKNMQQAIPLLDCYSSTQETRVGQNLVNFVPSTDAYSLSPFISNQQVFENNKMEHSMSNIPMNKNYCIGISGLNPNVKVENIQGFLQDMHIPCNNIKFQINEKGFKTDTAYVKLSNYDDFMKLLEASRFGLLPHPLVTSVCPDFIHNLYFSSELSQFKNNASYEHPATMPHEKFCCYLEGLPYSITYDDIRRFFHGLKIKDILIVHKKGKACGIGYVSFETKKDYMAAFNRHGKKIGSRIIKIFKHSMKEMIEAKLQAAEQGFEATSIKTENEFQENLDQPFVQSFPTTPMWSENPFQKEPFSPPIYRPPLCALLTGLPSNIQSTDILSFLSEYGMKPNAFHILLNPRQQPIGRAYVEFLDYLDFEAALKCHGKAMGNNVIGCRQVLREEMIKVLSTQNAEHGYGEGTSHVALHNQMDPPAKLPYLWEPPDGDSHKVDCTSGSYDRGSLNVYKHNYTPDKRIKSFGPRNSAGRKQRTDFLPNDTNSNNFRKYHYESTGIGKKNISHEQSNTEVKNKFSFLRNTEVDKIIDETPTQYGTKRLSPKQESTIKKEFTGWNKTTTGFKRSAVNRREIKVGMNSTLKKTGSINYTNKRSSRYKKRYIPIHKSQDLHQSLVHLKPNQRYKQSIFITQQRKYKGFLQNFAKKNLSPDSQECVVQITNVHPAVETQELLKFLHGFNLPSHKFVRRFTADGDITEDVRVTFQHAEDAHKALNLFNGKYLRGKCIAMHMVK